MRTGPWLTAFLAVNFLFPYAYRYGIGPTPWAEIVSARGLVYALAIVGMVVANGVLILLANRAAAMVCYTVSVLNVASLFMGSLSFLGGLPKWHFLVLTVRGLAMQG